MKHEEIRTRLRASATHAKLRSATEFWSDFNRMATETAEETSSVFVPKRHAWFTGFYPTLASAASIAACVAIYFTAQHKPESYRALDSFCLGSELPNNGAVVITDEPTDATILWVMTEEEK